MCPLDIDVVAKKLIISKRDEDEDEDEDADEDVSYSFGPNIELDATQIDGNNYATINTSAYDDEEQIVVALTTTYDGSMPNLYNSTRLYRIIHYNDLQEKTEKLWYYDSLFKATNLGIVSGIGSGDENDPTVNFEAEKGITRAELLAMLLNSVDVDISEYDKLTTEKANELYTTITTGLDNGSITQEQLNILRINEVYGADAAASKENLKNYLNSKDDVNGEYWARNYMNYAYEKGLINAQQYLGLDYYSGNYGQYDDSDLSQISQSYQRIGGGSIKVRRCDAAYMLSTMYIENIFDVNVPIKVYEYTTGIPCEKNTYWNNDSAFEDVDRSYPFCTEQIYQMYMNGIMVGNENRYFNPMQIITRAELCSAVVRCLFDMDEALLEVETIQKGEVQEEPIQVVVDSEEKLIENILFYRNNKVVYDIVLTDNHKYLIETTGDLMVSNLCGEVTCISGNGQIAHKKGSSDITNLQQEHIWYVIDGEGTYRFTLTRAGTEKIDIKITDMEKIPKLEFTPKSGGRYVYANNREAITKESLADNNNPNGSELLFQQSELKTGIYTIMIEHRSVIEDMDIYLDMQFYDPNNSSKITITKYGDDLFGNGHNDLDGNQKSWSCMKGYAEYFGDDVGRIRKQSADVDSEDSSIIYATSGISSKIINTAYNFENDNAIWLSQLYNGIYPKLSYGEGMYIMMEIEVESEEGIEISIAAFEAIEPYQSRLNQYLPTNDAPYYYDDSFKGITQFKAETEADLELFVDDEKITNSTNNTVTQPITITNPFATNGIEVWWWHTHMNPQVERWNANHNVESDILPLYYFDSTKNKTFIFDTKHKADYDNDDLQPAELTEGDFGSNNVDIACNLGNFGVKTTYKMSVANTGDSDRIFVYKINTISNMFLAVRNEYGEYLNFYVDGQYVKAICSGQATGKGKLFPITDDNSDIKVELPINNGEEPIIEEIVNEEGEVEQKLQNPDTETELQIKLPANSRLTFYVDEVLPTGNPGSITTSILFR